MEYLVTTTTRVPDGTPDETVRDVRGREAFRAREPAAQEHLLRLWRPPLRARRDDTKLGFKCPRQFAMASSAAR
jgi:muconolactone delta-isomerase